MINMDGIKDETFKAEIMDEAEAIAARARKKCAELLDILDNR